MAGRFVYKGFRVVVAVGGAARVYSLNSGVMAGAFVDADAARVAIDLGRAWN